MQDLIRTATATIATGESLSGAATLTPGYHMVGVLTDSSWDSAKMTFQVSIDNSTYYNLYDDTGTEYGPSAALPAGAVAMALYPVNTIPWRFIKVRSGTSASATNQSGATTVTIVMRQFGS